MAYFVEYRIRAVTRFIVTRCEISADLGKEGEVLTTSEVASDFSNLGQATKVGEALARGESSAKFFPYEGPPPGKVMRCKAVMTHKTPNVSLAYVWREEDAPGRYTATPYEYEQKGEKRSSVTITLDPTDPANYRQDGVNVCFAAVWGGQDPEDGKNACRENRIFADATPNVTFNATVRNNAVTDRMEVGEEFYVDFIPAPKQ